MPFNPKVISPQQIGNSSTVCYQSAPNCKATKIIMCTFTNNTGTNRILNTYLVPPGGLPGVTNQVTPGVSIPAGGVYTAFELIGHMLEPGGTLQASCDAAAALTVQGSLVEQS